MQQQITTELTPSNLPPRKIVVLDFALLQKVAQANKSATLPEGYYNALKSTLSELQKQGYEIIVSCPGFDGMDIQVQNNLKQLNDSINFYPIVVIMNYNINIKSTAYFLSEDVGTLEEMRKQGYKNLCQVKSHIVSKGTGHQLETDLCERLAGILVQPQQKVDASNTLTKSSLRPLPQPNMDQQPINNAQIQQTQDAMIRPQPLPRPQPQILVNQQQPINNMQAGANSNTETTVGTKSLRALPQPSQVNQLNIVEAPRKMRGQPIQQMSEKKLQRIERRVELIDKRRQEFLQYAEKVVSLRASLQPPVIQTQTVQIDTPLQVAFKAFRKDQDSSNLKQKFQLEFLKINQNLFDNVKKVAAAFILTPQNQQCIESLEKSLSELSEKIHADLQQVGKLFGAEDFSFVAAAVLETMVSEIKGLSSQHIQSMRLLADNWEQQDISRYGYPTMMLRYLLDKVRLQFPLSQEQNDAHKKLEEDINKINKDYKLNNLLWEVHDYFEDRLIQDQEETQKLITHLNEAGVEIPKCLSSLLVSGAIKSRSLPQVKIEQQHTTIYSPVKQTVSPIVISNSNITTPRPLPRSQINIQTDNPLENSVKDKNDDVQKASNQKYTQSQLVSRYGVHPNAKPLRLFSHTDHLAKVIYGLVVGDQGLSGLKRSLPKITLGINGNFCIAFDAKAKEVLGAFKKYQENKSSIIESKFNVSTDHVLSQFSLDFNGNLKIELNSLAELKNFLDVNGISKQVDVKALFEELCEDHQISQDIISVNRTNEEHKPEDSESSEEGFFAGLINKITL